MKSERSSKKSKIGDRKGYLAVLVNPRRTVIYTNPSVLNLNSMGNSSGGNPLRPGLPSHNDSLPNPPHSMLGAGFGNFHPSNPALKFPINQPFPANSPVPLASLSNPGTRDNMLGQFPLGLIQPGFNSQAKNPNLQNPNTHGNFPQPKISAGNNLLETLSNILKSSKQEENVREDYEDQQFWSGFFTRSKKNRVGVDALHVSGEEIQINDFNLNISFRISFDEVLKKKHCTIVLFVPSNETQNGIFQEYITYFKEKARAGVIPLRNHTLYIFPSCEESKKYHHLRENQLLGVFVKASDDRQVNSVAMNQGGEVKNEKSNESLSNIDKELSNLKPLLENEEFMNILNNIKY